MGGLEGRLGRLERVDELVERRVEEELEAVLDRLEEHLSPDEYKRVLRIIAAQEEGGRPQRRPLA
ncbi:MAG: hypothetical protein LC781_09700 [Actinobacteria bacterium]|nr:hypothetical protein [Actinomycetota bacterium]